MCGEDLGAISIASTREDEMVGEEIVKGNLAVLVRDVKGKCSSKITCLECKSCH